MTDEDTQKLITSIAYTANSITFTCGVCGSPMLLDRRPGAIVSGIFCNDCKTQYYIRWDDGILHKVEIEETHAIDVPPQEAATPLTNAQLAQQILLWIRRYRQEIRGQSKIDIALRRSLLITEIETLCKEQIGKKPMANQEQQPASLPGLIEGRIIHYVAYSGRHLAGMIIGHEGNAADLVIFTNMSNVNGVKNFGMQFHQDIEYSELLKPGTWHWPEKA